MSPAALSVVTPGVESAADRANRLLREARAAAQEQVAALEEALATVGVLAKQIAEGGDLYSPGARELCRKLAEDANWSNQTLEAILHHTR